MQCDGCGNKQNKLSWRSLFVAVVSGWIVVMGLLLISGKKVVAKPACMSREQVAEANKELGKCLTIFGGGVYDFTTAKKWDLTGHVGKHLCGKEYNQATIEAGPHPIAVIDGFYLTNVCGEKAIRAKKEGLVETIRNWPLEVMGMSWFRLSAYVSLVFFVLNFLSCYAMPWARVRQPWEGEIPGHDKNDSLGRFPLTHWHKYFAWLAVFGLSLHGALGFACVWFGQCF